jgi:hypothetical protein
MAEKIKAIRTYSPRIKLGITQNMYRLVRFMSARSGLNEGTIMNVLMELRDTITHHAMIGEPTKLDGLGTFTPSVDLEGAFKMNYRADKQLKALLNVPEAFVGDMENKDMIGKSVDELVDRWNEEHPDDPVEEPKDKDKK